MSKTKIDRRSIYNKYKGHCAYCGNKIKFHEMQIDHILSKRQYKFMKPAEQKKVNLDGYENLNPSCRRCNYYKGSYSIEGFRRELKLIQGRFMKFFLVKLAIQYGMIEIKEWNGVFHFEKHKLRRTK